MLKIKRLKNKESLKALKKPGRLTLFFNTKHLSLNLLLRKPHLQWQVIPIAFSDLSTDHSGCTFPKQNKY
ncbi:hypothetical protein GZ78_22955 [Endozoicomonas numazuensis]|uniref:Uncharacterized protein n=1 Tax=Endozoicomonas numazuensis TaxID=1137799 RepID=A0A081NCF4_9GAMM|nr:hypothetical protein GZ78_22955 [Endozoicomonas numazuensis]